MSRAIAAFADIRWDVDGYRDLVEDALFLLGDSREEFDAAERDIERRIEEGLLDKRRMAEVLVFKLSRLEWLVVKTGQKTSCNFVVTTKTQDITYLHERTPA